MPRHIKQAALTGQQEEAGAKVKSTVETSPSAVMRRCASSASVSTNGRRRAFA